MTASRPPPPLSPPPHLSPGLHADGLTLLKAGEGPGGAQASIVDSAVYT